MREPERLFSSDPELARIRELLESDGPPAGALERATRRALAAESLPSAPSLGASAGAVSASSITLWGVVALGVALVAAGGATMHSMVRAEEPSFVASSSPFAEVVVPGAAPAPPLPSVRAEAREESGAAEPVFRVEDLPAASREHAASVAGTPRAPSTARTPRVDSTDPFVEELALVERARAALAQGEAHACLEAVNRYEARFARNGVFNEEVEVMRIEALAMSGMRAQARARGGRFLETHPETPYAERVRRVLDRLESER